MLYVYYVVTVFDCDKIKFFGVFWGFFVCHVGVAYFGRPVSMFSTLTKYSFDIYSSVFLGVWGVFRGRNKLFKTSASF